MRKLKSAILGAFLFISVGGCATLPQVGEAPQDAPAVVAAVVPYVGPESHCSAVVIDTHLAATAGHCVRSIGRDGVLVRPDGVVVDIEATWSSPERDIAMVRTVDTMGELRAPVAQVFPRLGSGVLVAGYGCDSTWDMERLGVRLARYSGRDSHGAMVFDGLVCHGDSGGAVFDADGALVAVSVWVDTDVGPVRSFGAEPIAGLMDGLTEDAGWVH